MALGVTASLPPGTRTDHGKLRPSGHSPAATAAATADATAPVPHDSVRPEPRSCTRISSSRSPVTLMTSTFAPPVSAVGASMRGAVKSMAATG